MSRANAPTKGSVPGAIFPKEKAAVAGDFSASGPAIVWLEPGYFVADCGVPGRIRTRDPLLRRQPLYPLSYWDSNTL